MAYPVAYRSGAKGFQNFAAPSPAPSRAPLRSVEGGRVSRGPLRAFGGGVARAEEVAFGKLTRRTSIAASTSMLERGALTGAARLLPRLVPWIGGALIAYDLWQLYRDLYVFPDVDMANYGYVRTVVCATYHEFAKETQPANCSVQGGSGPGFSPTNPRPRRYGTWRRNLNGVGWFGHESFIRPLTDPLPNGYRPAWSTSRANPYRPGVASPGIGVPALDPAPSGSPSPTPFVWAPPGVGPHPGDLPNDYPIHIPPPRWVLPHFPRTSPWPQWREEGNDFSPRKEDLNAGRVITDFGVGVDAMSIASPALSPGRSPAKPNEKERKLRSNGDGVRVALGRAISAYTEVSDFVDAVYKGLPAKLRKKLKKDGKAKDPWQRAQAVWSHLDQMNWDMAVKAIIIDQLTDAAVGRLYAGAQRGSAKLDPTFHQWRRVSFNGPGAFQVHP